jgi:glycosyltransferase involved in cell wall biosynthesis
VARLKISLITPSFNQARFIERTIRSIVEQRGDFELEYLVCDGGSTDGTLDILRRYDGKLTWISEPDHGQVDAINKGLRRATGDVLSWVNSDDTLRPDALDRVAKAFQEHPESGWLHGRCDIVDEQDHVIRKWISAYKHWCCVRYSYARLLTENFISQMTVFWRRSLMDKAGLVDPAWKLAFDYDLWLRFGAHGAPLYLRQPLACFRWYGSSKSGAQFKEQFREDFRVAQKHAPGRRGLLLLKRLRTARIVTAYRVMSLLRNPL